MADLTSKTANNAEKRRNRMDARIATKLAAGLIAIAVCGGAAAQGSGAAPDASAAGVTTSAKASRLADRQLTKQVRHALAKTKGLSDVNVAVRVKRGVVTLRGSVPDSRQVGLAGQVAGGVSGVTSVDNQLAPFRQAQ
jgi:hyperosmotically inducible protein